MCSAVCKIQSMHFRTLIKKGSKRHTNTIGITLTINKLLLTRQTRKRLIQKTLFTFIKEMVTTMVARLLKNVKTFRFTKIVKIYQFFDTTKKVRNRLLILTNTITNVIKCQTTLLTLLFTKKHTT
jgi:hypothetical protein